jgi:CheY-like chemotaxis protein
MNFRHTILLVDQDPAIRGLMATRLGQLGYRIAEAESPDAARAAAARELPAMILVDRGLPGNGHQARAIVASLKNDPRVAHIPVLMTTARAPSAS